MTYDFGKYGTNVRKTRQGLERDREQWAGETQILMEAATVGAGTSTTEMIPFGVTYEGKPFFTWHVELLSGSLVAGDFPSANAFVTAWDYEERTTGLTFYRGAQVSLVVGSSTAYELGFMLSFVGKTFKGPLA